MDTFDVGEVERQPGLTLRQSRDVTRIANSMLADFLYANDGTSNIWYSGLHAISNATIHSLHEGARYFYRFPNSDISTRSHSRAFGSFDELSKLIYYTSAVMFGDVVHPDTYFTTPTGPMIARWAVIPSHRMRTYGYHPNQRSLRVLLPAITASVDPIPSRGAYPLPCWYAAKTHKELADMMYTVSVDTFRSDILRLLSHNLRFFAHDLMSHVPLNPGESPYLCLRKSRDDGITDHPLTAYKFERWVAGHRGVFAGVCEYLADLFDTARISVDLKRM
jgi:hypothetical protein